jgi:hypothetical protein
VINMMAYRSGLASVSWNRESGTNPGPGNWGTLENWAQRDRNRHRMYDQQDINAPVHGPVQWADPGTGGPPAPVVYGAGVTQAFERPWDVPPPPALGFATAPATSHRKPSIWANLLLAGILLVGLAGIALAVTLTTGPTP